MKTNKQEQTILLDELKQDIAILHEKLKQCRQEKEYLKEYNKRLQRTITLLKAKIDLKLN